MKKQVLAIAAGLLVVGLLSACGAVPTVLQKTAGTLGVSQGLPIVQAGGVAPNQAGAAAGSPQAQSTPVSNLRTITVSGTGQAVLTPDLAHIYIGVHSENANASEALSSNKTQTQKVIDAIKAMGVDAKDIQTTNFSIYPQQQYDKSGVLSGTVYMVDNTVYVTERNLDKLGDLLDAAVTAGANNINSISFDVSDKTAALASARQAAVKDAQGTAQVLASAAGVTLGQVQSISINSSSTPIPTLGYGMGGGAAAPAASPVPISSGQLTLTVDVNIVYLIQ
jgi:uncharacterized protein